MRNFLSNQEADNVILYVILLYCMCCCFHPILFIISYHDTYFYQKELKGNGGQCKLDRRPNEDVVKQLEKAGPTALIKEAEQRAHGIKGTQREVTQSSKKLTNIVTLRKSSLQPPGCFAHPLTNNRNLFKEGSAGGG